jgi:hypothetical protein
MRILNKLFRVELHWSRESTPNEYLRGGFFCSINIKPFTKTFGLYFYDDSLTLEGYDYQRQETIFELSRY